MAPTCSSISDSPTREICEYLAKNHGIDPGDQDRGVEENVFQDGAVRREIVGAVDGDITQEINALALEIAREKYWKGNFQFARFLAPRLALALIPDDFDASTPEDAALRRSIDGAAFSGGKAIYDWMTQPQKRGGLGLSFDRSDAAVHRTNAEVYRDRTATCQQAVNWQLTLADKAGIPLVPVERFLREGVHLALATLDSRGRIDRLFDLSEAGGRGREGGRPLPDEIWSPISRLELHGHYDNSLAMSDPDPQAGEAAIDRALVLCPRHYLFLANKGYFVHQRALAAGDGDEKRRLLEAAADYYRRSKAANPYYQKAKRNLESLEVYLTRGNTVR